MKQTACKLTSLIALGLIFFMSTLVEGQKKQSIESEWTREKEEVKVMVERLLFEVGNYNEKALGEMMLEKANLGGSSYEDGKWQSFSLSMNEYFESNRTRQRNPFYEPVQNWDILINQGQMAMVQADATYYSFGIRSSRNIDNFTLLKVEGEWKFLSISYTRYPYSDEERVFDMEKFARGYAQAWSGVRPNFVALFFEEDGSLQVNDGDPAKGRNEIANIAKGFMTDLPDMVVRYDSIVNKDAGTEFHWTLIATNTGPDGTGNKVQVSGFEVWQMGENGRIQKSQGHFPSEEYERQLESGY